MGRGVLGGVRAGCRRLPGWGFGVVLVAGVWAANPVGASVPLGRVFEANEPIGFSTEAGLPVVSATVYYRAVGARRFLARAVPVVDGQVSVELPASAAVPPGTEYYLEVRTADGRVLTDPPAYPRYNPHRLVVAIAEPPRIALVGDATGPLGPGDGLVLQVGEGVEGVRYFFDGIDVTETVRVSGASARYDPPTDLAPGRHVFAAEDGAGRRVEVPIEVAGAPEGGPRGVLGVNGSLSFNYGYNARNKGGSSGNRVSGNLHVEAHAEKGDFTARFSGVNIQYDKDAPDKFTISSGYLLDVAYGDQRIEFGDLTVNETPLTVSGFSRRGAQLHLQVGRTEVRAFDVRTDTVDGWESGLFSSGNENQAFGVSVASAIVPDGGLDVHLTALTGKNTNPSGAYDESSGGAQEGDTVGVQLGTTLWGARLDGQFAYSRFDADTSTGEGKVADTAWEVRLTDDLGFGTVNLGYLRYGTDYATIANPSFTGDRQGADGGFSTQLGPVSWSLSGAFAEDNVARDAAKPIVRSLSGDTNLGWRMAAGPSLSLGYSVSRQDSRKEPAGSTGIDNLNQGVSATVAHAGGIWNASLAGNLGFLDDRTPTDNDTDTRNATLSAGVAGTTGSANASLSYNQSITAARTDRSRLASLTLAVPVWPEWVDLSGQGSYQLVDASDGTSDMVTTGGSVRLSWNVGKLVERTWVDWVNVQLAVSGEYNRVDDRIDDANDADEYLTFLTFNFGAPYRFGAETQW